MKISSLLLILILNFSQLAQGSNIQSESVSKENGIRVSFDSNLLQEKRNLWIHLPANYHESKDTYPVLYLLDGDRHFQHAVTAATLLAEQERIPEMIVVGLPNNPGTRGRDLGREREKFIQFIETEVFGYINKQYRTSGINTLFGHSMAGYFTSRTLATHPNLFEKYIAASPVLQNGDKAVYKAFTKLAENKNLL
ncbi:MAG: esterase family protein, partial [Kangiellaceae bacterium]|nr:esterase family protein [Kangiellaceae bacterium]